jgi:site-specific recombinase XerD
VRAIPRPKPEQTAIVPYSKEDVQAMLAVCKKSKPYTRSGKRQCSNTRPTAERDRAIILLLLDTGVRVSEVTGDPKNDLLGLRIQDVDRRNLRIKVMGKGSKERILPISSSTSKAIWRYLLQRPNADPIESLFLSSKDDYPLTRSGILQLIRRLGQRAGIPDAYPHRFRHTFAINFLRNGGNALELKRLLGHSTLEMVQRYVSIAQVDVENAHKRASPVSNWHL